MKTSRADFKNVLKVCRSYELLLKGEILLSKIDQKKTKVFWKEVKTNKESLTVSRCINDTSLLQDAVNIFDQKYQEVMDNSEC